MRLLVLFILLVVSPFIVFAQDQPPLCQVTNSDLGVDEADTVFARYDWQNAQLTVVSWTTGNTMRELETNFPVNALYIADWSPNCRYLLAEVTRDAVTELFAWDVTEGQRVGILNSSADRYRVNWSGAENLLVVQLYGGAYLWNVQTNEQVLLNNLVDTHGRSLYSIEWDMNRNELLVVKIGSGNGVSTYSLATYQQTGFFHIGNRAAPVTYRRLSDNRHLLVYTTGRETTVDSLPEGLALWDRDTQAHIQLDPDFVGFALTGFSTFDVIGDLSSRYFIIGDYGVNQGRLYVWDLQNLVGEFPHVPNYQQSLFQAGDMRLLDANTLEVADWSVWAYVYTPHSVRSSIIDLSMYSLMAETPKRRYDSACDNPPSDLEWACERASVYSYRNDRRPGMNNSTYYQHQPRLR